MTKLEVELHEDVVSVLHKLKDINDTGIELIVPEGAVLFDNVLNLKLLQKWSDKEEKVINFQTDDLHGQSMLMSLEDEGVPSEEIMEEDISAIEQEVPTQKFSMPKVKLALPVIKLKKGRVFFVLFLVLAFLGLSGFFGYKKVAQMPKAQVKIIVNSQPLTRSFEIKVKHNNDTDAENKILRGTTAESSLEDEVIIETTGEKIVGEKAEGEITIFNKTDEEKKFKEDTEVIYEDDDDDEYVYELKEDVTVPPREEASDSTPAEPKYISGNADVEVEAQEIGKDYNLDEGENLKIEDQDDSDYEAEVNEDIDGGKEETIMVVAQEDIDDATQRLLENSREKALRALGEKISGEQKLVGGSENVAIVKETFSHELEDETEELALSQTFSAKGLVYNPDDLDKLIELLMEEFVPEGFVLSTKERIVNVEVLGNTETTLLSSSEADLQVTLKTYVITDISEETIKQALMGKSPGDAEKYLGSIRNVKTYELNINPRIPLFDYIPKDESRIVINLERE